MPQNWRHPMQQQVEERPKKRKKQEKKLEFEAGKVFTPGEVKEEDFELDLDSARFKAQKGQGGDRRAGHLFPPPRPAEFGLYVHTQRPWFFSHNFLGFSISTAPPLSLRSKPAISISCTSEDSS